MMYGPWGYPQPPPQTPIVYLPSPGANQGGFDIDGITRQIAGLEALKKLMKEEKKDDKDKDKRPDPKIASMMLFMILISPVTGPVMSRFFEWGRGMMH